jgi:glucoamylase
MWSRNPTVLSGGCAVLVGTALLTGIGTPNVLADTAPGGPGQRPTWAPANKDGFGTAKDTGSKVWYTLQGGGLSEVYYPDLGTPSVRDLQFIVSDGHSFAERESDATRPRLHDGQCAGRVARLHRDVDRLPG